MGIQTMLSCPLTDGAVTLSQVSGYSQEQKKPLEATKAGICGFF